MCLWLFGSWIGGLAGEGIDAAWAYLWRLRNAGHRAVVRLLAL